MTETGSEQPGQGGPAAEAAELRAASFSSISSSVQHLQRTGQRSYFSARSLPPLHTLEYISHRCWGHQMPPKDYPKEYSTHASEKPTQDLSKKSPPLPCAHAQKIQNNPAINRCMLPPMLHPRFSIPASFQATKKHPIQKKTKRQLLYQCVSCASQVS